MYQIKIFEGHGDNQDDVNSWLKTNPQIEVVNVSLTPMHDLYSSGVICNQWISTIVIYKMITKQTE